MLVGSVIIAIAQDFRQQFKFVEKQGHIILKLEQICTDLSFCYKTLPYYDSFSCRY